MRLTVRCSWSSGGRPSGARAHPRWVYTRVLGALRWVWQGLGAAVRKGPEALQLEPWVGAGLGVQAVVPPAEK